MTVDELIGILSGMPGDAPVDAEVRLDDGTRVLAAEVVSAEHDRREGLGLDWVTLDLVTDREELAESDALATVTPEALEWVARHGEPLPGSWGCDER